MKNKYLIILFCVSLVCLIPVIWMSKTINIPIALLIFFGAWGLIRQWAKNKKKEE